MSINNLSIKLIVIVESPAKISKIESFLGSGWKETASYGHFRDLPKKELGISVNGSVEMNYEIQNHKVVKDITKLVSNCDTVYLCTDPDREGEAIAWHLKEVLNLKKGEFKRAVFNSITRKAVQAAIDSAQDINYQMADAQQARRAIDRLFGFLVSQKLWEFEFKRAGRVQSPALWIIVDIERRRKAFIPRYFWTVAATYEKDDKTFIGNLIKKENDKYIKQEFDNQSDAEKIQKAITGEHKIISVEKKRVQKYPPAPFTTSTLQQFAGSHLKLNPGETMKIAQKLYENGHITYMRTDSVELSEEAVEMAREIIAGIDEKLLPEKPPVYKNKGDAQEAHEAVRPTHKDDSSELNGKEYELYEMIRLRFLSSQCIPAEFDNTDVVLQKDEHLFKATGRVQAVEGFLSIYNLKSDDDKKEETTALPNMQENENINCTKAENKKGTTKPPQQLTQPQLTKRLEKEGIGRPSTYANIIETILKEYAQMADKRKIVPTEAGMKVIEALETGFNDYYSLNIQSP